MAAHSAPSARRQLRTTALTSIATALAVVGLMFAGSALTTSTPGREPVMAGTTTGPIALLDAPSTSTPTATPTPPAVRKSDAPRPSGKPTASTTKRPTTTTTTTARTTRTSDD